MNNWASLPTTARRQLYDLADNINPPDPTPELKQNIEDILIKAGGSIQLAIRAHMQSRRAAQVNILKKLMKEAAVIGTNKKRPIYQAITPPPADNGFKRCRMNGSTPPATASDYPLDPPENITPDLGPELEPMDEADIGEHETLTTGPSTMREIIFSQLLDQTLEDFTPM